jgi:8-oxo-dGTP diphosphatase
MPMNHPLKGNAGCLVIHNGFVLAVQLKRTGKWDLPAGKPIGEEKAEQTAIRETFEETGLKVSIKRLLHIFTHGAIFYLYEGVLLSEPKGDLIVPVKAKDEIKKVAFVDFQKIPVEMFRYPEALPIINKLIDDIKAFET